MYILLNWNAIFLEKFLSIFADKGNPFFVRPKYSEDLLWRDITLIPYNISILFLVTRDSLAHNWKKAFFQNENNPAWLKCIWKYVFNIFISAAKISSTGEWTVKISFVKKVSLTVSNFARVNFDHLSTTNQKFVTISRSTFQALSFLMGHSQKLLEPSEMWNIFEWKSSWK